MVSLVPELYAMAPQSGQGGAGMTGQLVLFGAIFVIFFLLVIRPQQKRAKQHKSMLGSMQKGDQVITASGIYGKINKTFDDKDYLLLEITDKTVIKIQKSQVAAVTKSKAQKEDSEDSKEKKTEEKKADA